MKLSIIVPIYNVEPYLRKCVDSLLVQDLSANEYEIILVDDGSPDGCPVICDEYATQSNANQQSAISNQQSLMPRIKVLHQPNAGLSAARNSGLKVAQGKYIQFVDSDDYLEPNVLGGLVAQMEREDLDVLRFDYQNVRVTSDGTYEIFQPYKHPHQVDKRTDVVDGITYLNERMGYACYAVMFMIRREMLLTNNLTFTEGILFEDTEWTPRMLLAARRVNGTTAIAYNYLLREGSITGIKTRDQAVRSIESKFVVNNALKKMAKQTMKNQWLRGNISDNVYGMLNNIARYDFDNCQQWIRRMKNENYFPLYARKISIKMRIKYIVINASPLFYVKIMHALCK